VKFSGYLPAGVADPRPQRDFGDIRGLTMDEQETGT